MYSKSMSLSLILASALASTVASASDSSADLAKELAALKAELNELKATVKNANVEGMKKELSAIKKVTAGDNIKFSADYRYTIDSIQYKHASGAKSKNRDFMSNRLILGMKYAPTDNLSFFGDLAYNKAFGDTANHSQSNINPGFSNFDWITNENAIDNTLKVRQAYFLYRNSNDVMPFTASVGRRPSFGGYPLNLREGDQPNSPASHLINVEFDGASFKFDLDKLTDVTGMYLKLCLGRGLTNAKSRFSKDNAGTPYTKDRELHSDIDMMGFIFVPYDDGQYTVFTNFAWANNLIGYTMQDMQSNMAAWGAFKASSSFSNFMAAQSSTPNFRDVGNWSGGAITLGADGVGDGWSDFLDDTKAFVSWAFSRTAPRSGMSMLGSTESKRGYSWYAGVQIPAMLSEKGRIGIEWNRGSKYWRPVTYGEDTVIGSKIATRGNAWEVYYYQPLIGKDTLTMDVRFTHIKYDYTGSNAFFGDDGAPMSMGDALAMSIMSGGMMPDPVEKASDLRVAFRYRY
ncbi:MAG: DUF3373 family protein [Wolinella sp.]